MLLLLVPVTALAQPTWILDLTVPESGHVILTLPASSYVPDTNATHIIDRQVQDLVGGETHVRLTLDPTFYPPGETRDELAYARAFTSAEFAVLRTDRLFPRVAPGIGAVRLQVALPPGWIAVVPWKEAGADYLITAGELSRADYVGFGPFRVREHEAGEVTLRIGVHEAASEIEPVSIGAVFAELSRVFGGPPPRSRNTYSVVIVPPKSMHGGASGAYTIVQPPVPVTLTHEMVHWWNYAGRIAEDARWFIEGFTEYYGVEAARRAGLITAEWTEACFADLYGEARHIATESHERSLREASLHYGDPADRYAGRIVYAKGAMLAWLAQRELAQHDRSLDEGMRSACMGTHLGLDSDALVALWHEVYDGALDALFDAYLDNATPLPENLPFGPPTGLTGVARYLPVPGDVE